MYYYAMASFKRKYAWELVAVLMRAAREEKLLHEFLLDILTPAEYGEISVRWQIVTLLSRKAPQREIARKLGVSVATVSRGARELLNKKGGFNRMLGILGKDL